MKNISINKIINNSFYLGIILKGLNGITEIISGALLFFISYEKISNLIQTVTQEELLEDPTDFIANNLLTFSKGFSVNSETFLSLYLLSHGIVKIFLVYCLLKNKLWAYPVSIIVFMSFVIYQIYRYTHTHSLGLIVITIIDIIIIVLTALKYRKLKTNEK